VGRDEGKRGKSKSVTKGASPSPNGGIDRPQPQEEEKKTSPPVVVLLSKFGDHPLFQ